MSGTKVEITTLPGFEVKVTPEKVQVTRGNEDSSGNLTIAIKNIGAGEASIRGMSVTLPVGEGESDLAQPGKTSNIKASAGNANVWSFKPVSTVGAFEVRPVSGNLGVIGKGEMVLLYLNDIVFNHVIGAAQVTVKIIFPAAADNITIPAAVIKEETAVMVRFYAEPSDINPGQTAVLKWGTQGIDYCKLSEYPDERLPANGSRNVNPNFSRSYTLLAYAANVLISTTTSVNVVVPQGRFWCTRNRVDYGEKIILEWSCNEYTRSVTLTCDDPAVTIPSSLQVSDRKEIGPLTKTLLFTLTIFGNNGVPADIKTIQVIVNPAGIGTFTATPDTGLWAKDPVTITWSASSYRTIEISPPDGFPSPMPKSGSAVLNPIGTTKYILTVTGAPGGRHLTDGVVTREIALSVSEVHIAAFSVSPNPIRPVEKTGNKTTLSWAVSGQLIKINDAPVQATGTQIVNAPGLDSSYTLKVGTTQNPELVVRTINVINQYGPFTFNSFKTLYDYPVQVTAFIVNEWQKLPKDDSVLFYMSFTGVTIDGAPAGVVGAVDKHQNPIIIQAMGDLRDGMTFTKFSWADPKVQRGAITLTGIAEARLLPAELKKLFKIS